MRVALCANGRSPHAQRWANGLAARGHEVALVWTSDLLAGADLGPFDPSIGHYEYASSSALGRPLASARVRRSARALARVLTPDLVHGLDLDGPAWTAELLGIHPLVLSALGSDALRSGLPPGSSVRQLPGVAYRAWRTRTAVAAAAVVLADSVAIAAAIEQRFPGAETRIVRFGVEMDVPDERSSWRARLAIDKDAFVILSTRLVHPHYNIDLIIRAFSLVRRELPNTVLVLKELPAFSDVAYRKACLDLIEELDLEPAVRIVGELDRSELIGLVGASDVYVSVPATDGTSVSVLEAMAAEVAVVATAAPGIDSVILRDGETAILVPVGSSAATLASEILHLGRDPERRRILTQRAREVVEIHGNFELELDRASMLYSELVAACGVAPVNRRRVPSRERRRRSEE